VSCRGVCRKYKKCRRRVAELQHQPLRCMSSQLARAGRQSSCPCCRLPAKATVYDVSDGSMRTGLTSGMTGMCQQGHSQPLLRHKLSAYLAVLDEQQSASDDAEGPVAAAELERSRD
jgi:hypothetical protein